MTDPAEAPRVSQTNSLPFPYPKKQIKKQLWTGQLCYLMHVSPGAAPGSTLDTGIVHTMFAKQLFGLWGWPFLLIKVILNSWRYSSGIFKRDSSKINIPLHRCHVIVTIYSAILSRNRRYIINIRHTFYYQPLSLNGGKDANVWSSPLDQLR